MPHIILLVVIVRMLRICLLASLPLRCINLPFTELLLQPARVRPDPLSLRRIHVLHVRRIRVQLHSCVQISQHRSYTPLPLVRLAGSL